MLAGEGAGVEGGEAVGTAEETGDFFKGALGGGEADALDFAAGEGFEALEREGHVCAALRRDEGVDFIDDDGFDRAEGFAGVGGEEEVEGFWRGDEDVAGVLGEAGAVSRGGVAGADADFRGCGRGCPCAGPCC